MEQYKLFELTFQVGAGFLKLDKNSIRFTYVHCHHTYRALATLRATMKRQLKEFAVPFPLPRLLDTR